MIKVDMPMPRSCLFCPFKQATRTNFGYVAVCGFDQERIVVMSTDFVNNPGAVNYVDTRHPKCRLMEE